MSRSPPIFCSISNLGMLHSVLISFVSCRNNGTALSRVAGTAAGLLGTVQGFWGSSTPASNGLDTILSASFDDIAFDPRLYVPYALSSLRSISTTSECAARCLLKDILDAILILVESGSPFKLAVSAFDCR